MARFRWFRKKTEPSSSTTKFQGCLETISPTLLTGWVFHPHFQLCEVRLVSGTRLIAAGPVDEDRPDVAAHVGREGRHGFALSLPDVHQELSDSDPLHLLTLTADGQGRFPVNLRGADADVTRRLLQRALSPSLRGLQGHFDGLSGDGQRLGGWCYPRQGGTATVWLHARGLQPRPVVCRELRPSMKEQGHREDCGFSLMLHEWPEAAGHEVWASFDKAGELLLPSASLVRLPALPSASIAPFDLAAPSTADGELSLASPAAEAVPEGNPPPADLPLELQAHWKALEDFRLLIDRLEMDVQRAEDQSYRDALPASGSLLPRRKRSALFRLWR